MGRTRFGLVGTGYWAREVHAAGIAGHPDAELVGVWGRDQPKAEHVARLHGARAFTDFDAMLDAVDVVAFAVPPQVQADLATRAAAAGRHLLLEKPLATQLQSADRVLEAATRTGVSSVVFFTERFAREHESWLEARAAARSLGARVMWLASLQTPGNPFASSPWRKRDGALWDVGPHALAVLLPVLGPVTEVAGTRGPGDLVNLALRHETGATSTVALSLTMPPKATRFGVEYYDEEGWHVRPDVAVGIAETYQRAVSELLDQIRQRRAEHRCDLRFAREVVETLHRIEEALPSPAPANGT